MKNIGCVGSSLEAEKPPQARKMGRRVKKQTENDEMDDNDSDKGFAGAHNYPNYDIRNKNDYNMPNYSGISAFSSYMPPITQENHLHVPSTSFPSLNQHKSSYSYESDYYSRKFDTMAHNKVAESSNSSSEEHSMTPPEASISSTISSASATLIRPTTPNGNFRELSPSLIASHSIMKEDFSVGASPSDCAYRSNLEASGSAVIPHSKDMSLISKYNQESYRIYSHQLHHHHHYHYALQSDEQECTPPSNYPYRQYSTPIDTDEVDPNEMEQYLDSGKYRKLCYFKPEASLTELTPMNPTVNIENQLMPMPSPMPVKTDGVVPMNDAINSPNQPINSTYTGNYQDATTVPYQYMSNWVNYSI